MDSEKKMWPRILIVDDEQSIHDSLSQVLAPAEKLSSSKEGVKNLAAKLFDTPPAGVAAARYDLTFCYQGEKAVEEVALSIETDRNFSMVFLDMRMPPGKDGLWTAEKIRELDPMVNILIMTAYSDIDPVEISARVQPVDKLLYVQKPLRPQEIRQFAAALSTKWRSESELINTNLQLAAARIRLEKLLAERTGELRNTAQKLDEVQGNLLSKEEKLERTSTELEETSVAIRVLLKNIGTDNSGLEEKIREMDEKIVLNVNELTEPFLDKLETSDLNKQQKEYVSILRRNLERVTSSSMQRLYSDDHDLTPSEIQVANLIRQGKSTKDIASLLNLSTRTIEFHRENIRKKLGIKDRKTSLKTILKSM